MTEADRRHGPGARVSWSRASRGTSAGSSSRLATGDCRPVASPLSRRDVGRARRRLPPGVDVRHGDYADSSSPVRAFAGIEQRLFVASSALEGVAKQHDNVIRACAGRAVHPLGGMPGPPLVLEEAPERAEERSPGVGAAAYRRGARRLVAPHTRAAARAPVAHTPRPVGECARDQMRTPRWATGLRGAQRRRSAPWPRRRRGSRLRPRRTSRSVGRTPAARR
jgi:hypothetical protein